MQTVTMFSIGAYYGGPEQEGSPNYMLVSATMQAAGEVCGEWKDITTPRVNVVFFVPGSLEGYDFLTKIDRGRFSRKQRAVVVRVPVPKEMAKAGASVQFMVDAMLQASRIAADAFARKGIDGFDMGKAVEAVDQIKHLVHEKLKAQEVAIALSGSTLPTQDDGKSDATCPVSVEESFKGAESLIASVEGRKGDEREIGKSLSASSSANIIKLYKRFDGGWSYWEAWDAGDQSVVVHWGSVGKPGRTRRVPIPVDRNAVDVILRECKSPRLRGFKEIEMDVQSQVVVQFRTQKTWGESSDMEKCRRVEEVLNECLGWTGNGNCDGSDIGSGTINIFSFVLDPFLAKAAIVESLRDSGLLDGAVIAVRREDDYEVVWPSDYRGEFAIV